MATFDNGISLPPDHIWRRVKQIYTLRGYLLKIYNIMLTGRFTLLYFLRISRTSLACHSSLPLDPVLYDCPNTDFRRLYITSCPL